MHNEAEHIRDLRDNHAYTWQAIADRYGYDRKKVRRLYDSNPAIPSPQVDRSRFTPYTLTGDMLVTSDWHVPLHNPDMVNHLLDTAKQHDIRQLVIGGDFYNADSASRYPDKQPAKEAGFKLEKQHGELIFDVLLDTFDRIYMFDGNHDYRFVELFQRQMPLDVVVKEVLLSRLNQDKLDKLTVSTLDHMFLEQHKLYRFSHQRDFSTVPLTVGRKFAAKYRCSIMTAHSHHFAIGLAGDGHNVVIEAGGLFDQSVTQYVQSSTGHHNWVPGFTMFKGGVPTLFSPAFGNL